MFATIIARAGPVCC